MGSTEPAAPGAESNRGPVRVAFCVDNFSIGGTELNAVRTAEWLDRSRFQLEVVALRNEGPLRARYEAAGIPVRDFPIRKLYAPATLRQGLHLAGYLRSRRVEILHCHDLYSTVFAVPWARLAGCRVIASRRWWARVPRPGLAPALRLAYRLADRVLANSPRVAELLARQDRVPRHRLVVVPNFLDEWAFDVPRSDVLEALRGELGLPSQARVVGMVANLRRVKNPALLVRAAARLRDRWPELRVVFVGDGVMRDELASLGADLQLGDRLVFAGRRIAPPNLHHLFEISVLTSDSEGFPNSVLEAMAAARPVVATDVGGTADAVRDGETGLLVPAGDDARLAEALDRLLTQPTLAQQMGRRGLQSARAQFSPQAALARLGDLYDSLIDPHRRSPEAVPFTADALPPADASTIRPGVVPTAP